MMENTIKSGIKRIILVLIAVLMFGMATGCKMESFSSMGDAEYTERGLEVRLYGLSEDKTEYMVTGIGNCTDTDIVIPESYNGLPITGIGDRAFMDCSNITSVNIPNSVIVIDRSAFKNCTSLVEVELSNSLGYMGSSAFANCISLTNISLPASLTIMEENPFLGCSGLTNITVNSGNDVYHSNGNCVIETASKTLLFGCHTSVIPNDGSVKKIGAHSFININNLTEINIPNSVEKIVGNPFAGCSDLTNITVDKDNLVYHSKDNCLIETETRTLIAGCQASIIPDDESVSIIGENAFINCKNLMSINIPACISYIGGEVGRDNPFVGCSNLASITVDSNNPNYHSNGNCLIKTDSKKLMVGCYTSVIPADGTVEIIAERAFYDNTNLVSIAFPNSVKEIDDYAFKGCTGLSAVSFPDSVKKIGNSAFMGCIGLGTVSFPDSVKEIGEFAFEDCSSITTVSLPDGLEIIGRAAFGNCSSLKEITIPGSVRIISDRMLSGCTSLTSVIISEGVTDIEDAVFVGCTSLISVTIPKSVKSFEYNVTFVDCTNLGNIYFTGTKTEWSEIGKDFSKCYPNVAINCNG